MPRHACDAAPRLALALELPLVSEVSEVSVVLAPVLALVAMLLMPVLLMPVLPLAAG
jgi:hypothetical protein